jgi:hypothetical protein
VARRERSGRGAPEDKETNGEELSMNRQKDSCLEGYAGTVSKHRVRRCIFE